MITILIENAMSAESKMKGSEWQTGEKDLQ